MNRTIIAQLALAAVLGLALSGPLALPAFAQSGNQAGLSQQQQNARDQQLAAQQFYAPYSAVAPQSRFEPSNYADQQNGDGQLIDPVYGLPLPGQNPN